MFKNENWNLQVGGDDQWFTSPWRRVNRKELEKMPMPFYHCSPHLMVKMGKTEKGEAQIEASRLSVYDYYQYWVNVTDADVIKLMKLYTFMPLTEIAEYEKLQGADIRKAKHKLALEATALAHGIEAAKKAQDGAKAAFSGGQNAEMPSIDVLGSENIIDLLVRSELCKSKGDARRQMKGGAIKYDSGEGKKAVSDIAFNVDVDGVLWFGKKRCVRVNVQG